MSVIEHEKKIMVFQRCTKIVADLDPGCCSLGASSRTIEVTLRSFHTRIEWFGVVLHSIASVITTHSLPNIPVYSWFFFFFLPYDHPYPSGNCL